MSALAIARNDVAAARLYLLDDRQHIGRQAVCICLVGGCHFAFTGGDENMNPGISCGVAGVACELLLRIMQANKLTLERHTGGRPGRTHDGVVIALRSNIRWCSDHFELACRNGEIVRVLFAIDACDREVMGWLATSAGISGEMVRDLMICISGNSI